MKSTKYYLGLDVGGTNMVAGVVDENHQIIAKESIPTQAGRTIDEITADMAAVSKKAVLKAGLQIEDISSWGIGMPSYVNPKTNLLVHANCFLRRNADHALLRGLCVQNQGQDRCSKRLESH